MATKSAKSEKKTPAKRKRATPVKFSDDKVDSIVKEITENLKNSAESEEKLEEEVKLEVKERISEEGLSVEKNENDEKEDSVENSDSEKKAENDEAKELKVEKSEESTEENLSDTNHDEKAPQTSSEPEVKEEGAGVFAPDRAENPFPPLEDEPKKSFKWPLIYFILFLAGMVAGFVVFDQLSQRTGGNPPIQFGNASPTPTKEPSATPTPEAPDFSKYSIMVENGSGISGVAADTQDQLENAGFTVSEIGNADKSTYKQTVIQIKNGTNTDFLKALKATLEKSYVVADDTEELPDSEEFDAVVIVGSESAN